jgi:hypothetical protein
MNTILQRGLVVIRIKITRYQIKHVIFKRNIIVGVRPMTLLPTQYFKILYVRLIETNVRTRKVNMSWLLKRKKKNTGKTLCGSKKYLHNKRKLGTASIILKLQDRLSIIIRAFRTWVI